MERRIFSILLALMLAFSGFCTLAEGDIVSELGLNADVKSASEYTVQVNSAVYSQLDFADASEAENAVRGLIDAPETLTITDANGRVVWSQDAYSFLDDYEEAPSTVNPSLWENTKNNHAYGLFEVCEGIYQVRGYDMANLTVIAGETGWIVFDTLMSTECSQAAMQLIEKNLGARPVKAIVISHSHTDHFGGIMGIISAEDMADASLSIEDQIASGKVPVIVPEGFAEHAVLENIYAGMAMTRRTHYQYGTMLDAGVDGSLAHGIGMGQSLGTVCFLAPSYEICETGETITIDGIEMEFQLTPDTEAPAEMNAWLPQFNALWMAENCTATLHNLYTLRGAQVRDGAAWASYITQAVSRYGDSVELVFQSHNWPHWGNAEVNEYLLNTAAVYKYINDQTLTYINQGYTSDEISNMIQLPEALARCWYTRQYYGTVAHNAKAVYQKYMGWYDANPVNLNPLTPIESAQKWLEYLGDVDEVLHMAKADYESGEYQWVAEITSTLVYADPENTAARLLCADAMEQLGYQSESGAWRNAYLSAALELRLGNQADNSDTLTTDSSLILEMTPEMIFDYIAIVMDKQAMSEYDFTMNVTLIDVQKQYTLRFQGGAMLVFENELDENADLSITTAKNALLLVLMGNAQAAVQNIYVEGNADLLYLLLENMNQFDISAMPNFNIIEP